MASRGYPLTSSKGDVITGEFYILIILLKKKKKTVHIFKT
jgi:hypothetical protein